MLDLSTIAAISTPPGSGGVGMIRISGEDSPAIAARVFRKGTRGAVPVFSVTQSHRIHYGRVIDPSNDRQIDEALLAWMSAPHTYTRENTIELFCHGGPVPMQETLRVVLAAGARHAEPGEFTLRAFLNGRLDLTQAEAVLNVVSARTAEGLRLAVEDLRGDLSRRLAPARDAVVSLLAYLDAAADFPDDEIPAADVDHDLETALLALQAVVAGANAGILYREGVQIALIGRPNVGKSSLLNAILRAERAIVTPIAGTTRDVVSETANIRGIPVTLLDTAGISESENLVEQLGIERSRRALTAAGAAILVLDGTAPPTDADLHVARLMAERLGAGATFAPPVVIALNKRDLPARADQMPVTELLPNAPVVPVSSVTGDGVEEIEDALAALLRDDAVSGVQPAVITARQHAAIERALVHLSSACETRRSGFPLDLMATDVRAALHAIGEVTGESVDESVLTEIFSRFCIGK